MQNKPKIVFILATHSNTNNIKRIEAFVEEGYPVEVYAFSRGGGSANLTDAATINILCEFSNDLPYWKRLRIMHKGIKTVLKNTKGQNCIYYLIRNDVALLFSFMCRKPYIFEEADMTHVNFGNKWLATLTEKRIKQIIRRSVVSVFRSEGFVRYHFGDNVPENVMVIPNKLSPRVLDMPTVAKKPMDINHIKFGFVGVMRGRATYEFANNLLKNYPQHEFHFFGSCAKANEQNLYDGLGIYDNCHFHGVFKSPDELAEIYSQIDFVLATYETSIKSVNYLEPNKLYEAIYFDTPIIVTAGTFIGEKVNRLGIGFNLLTYNEDQVKAFVDGLKEKEIQLVISRIREIDKEKECVSKNYMPFLEKIICDYTLKQEGR